MALSQRIANILNGVSQQPPALRHPSEATEQINALALPSIGVATRPPLALVAKLKSDATDRGYYVHQFRTKDRKYLVVIADGLLEVYDEDTGEAQTVDLPAGDLAYLVGGSEFRAATVGDTTYVVNRNKTIQRTADVAPAMKYEALVFIRQVDFSTTYTLQVGSTTVEYTTPDATTPSARLGINTDFIASQIHQAGLLDDPNLDAIVLGSVIYITRKDHADFVISAQDGLADKAIEVVKGEVQSFADLPPRAYPGFRVKIVGDDSSDFDTYWVEYVENSGAVGSGTWRECAAPGTQIALDPATMPWKLQVGGEYLRAVSAGMPPLPSIVDGDEILNTVGPIKSGVTSDPTDPGNGSGDVPAATVGTGDGTQDVPITDHGGYATLKGTGSPGPDGGGDATVTAVYSVDTSQMTPGLQLTVTALHGLPGTTPTLLGSRTYDAGQTLKDESIAGTWHTLGLTDDSETHVVLTYSDKVGQVDFRNGTVTVHGTERDTPGASYRTVLSRNIIFSPTQSYPIGTVVTVALNDTAFTYTVPTDGKTGADVATALAALINANPAFAAVDSLSTLEVSTVHVGGAVPAPAVSADITFDNYVNCALVGVSLTPDAFVGKTIKNLTDGSTGHISTNSSARIRIDLPLSGGGTNTFRAGDVIQVVSDSSALTFGPETWDQRAAGDLTTAPFPSFTDHQLRSVFFYQGRLGFTWGQSVVLSQSGKQTNFFRQSAVKALSDDLIDVTAAHPRVVSFDSVVEWDGGLLLNGDDTQFKLSGAPALTLDTVRLDVLSEYAAAPDVQPFVSGSPVFLARSRAGAYTHLQVYQHSAYTGAYEAQDVTGDIPTYITGNPVEMVGDQAIGIVFVRTDGAPGSLFVYTYQFAQGMAGPELQKQYAGWSRWDFPGATIVGMSLRDGVLSLVTLRSDGAYLETLQVLTPPSESVTYADHGTIPYTFTYTPTPFYLRNANGAPEMQGWLTLHYVNIEYSNSGGFQVVVTPTGRTSYTYSKTNASVGSGTLHFPVGAKNDQVSFTITSTGSKPVCLTGFQWEGSFTTRGRRV